MAIEEGLDPVTAVQMATINTAEYFGLKGNPEYDEKTKYKQSICKKNGIQLISIYPSDLVNTTKLMKKMAPLFDKS